MNHFLLSWLSYGKESRRRQFLRIMRSISFLIFSCSTIGVYAGIIEEGASVVLQQTQNITGVVTDGGEPLPGVHVSVKGASIGTITDVEGKYAITVPDGNAVLVFSYIGFVTQEIIVGNQTFISVTLTESLLSIDEVVVVGYGTQKKVNLTGAVSSVSGEELIRRPVPNTSTMLQAQVPGLRVTQGRGQPGNEGEQFRIRGQGTYSSAGSDPLILINGVAGEISTLDPNIIESVTVLKDAASAAIYGSRAANGVILVTTKSGAGIKDALRFSYNGNYAAYQALSLLDLIWDSPTYIKYYNMARTNSNAPETSKYSEEAIAAYSNPNRDKTLYPSFDWVDYMFNTAFVQTHNLSASGTSLGGRTSYNISASFLDQPGVMRAQTYKRYNGAIDLTSRVNDYIRMGVYASASRGNRQQTAQGDTDAYLSTISQAPTYMPWLPGDETGAVRWAHRAYEHESANKNMAAIIATETFQLLETTDLNGQYWLELTPLKGLTWHTKAATRLRENATRLHYAIPLPQYMYHTGAFSRVLDTRGPGYTSSMNNRTYVNFYSTLKYDFNTRDNAHQFSIMGGFSQETDKYNSLSGYRQYYDFDLHELDAGTTQVQTNSGNSQYWAIQSWFGRFLYNYDNRYLFEANARYDGASRIAKENRWGLFPSFSAGWRLTEEKWFKGLGLDWLNNAKIRGSWGMLGNQNIDLYSYNAVVNLTTAYPFDNQIETSGVAQTAFSNRNLKWETTTITNIGVDLTLFKGLSITIDWYEKNTIDILRRAQATYLLGLSAPYINDGEMNNKGIEIDIQYYNTIRQGALGGLRYNIGGYIDRSRNKLIKFGAEEFGSGQIRRVGLPYNSFYCYDAIGIFKDELEVADSPKQFTDNTRPGDIKYRDVSGPDGVPDGKINEFDRIVVDGRFPKFEYAINLGANWQGFDISLLGQGVQGIKHFCRDWGIQPFYQGSPPTRDYLKNMWTEERRDAKYPRMYFHDMGGSKNNRESTFWLYDGSYFRVKNITLGYTFPVHWSGDVLNRLRVYFSADNPFTLTRFPQGGDPDRTNNSTHGTRLINYPQNKIYSLGINLEF